VAFYKGAIGVYPDGVHLLIATSGVLPPAPVADLAGRLLDPDSHVSVLTVIEAPLDFLGVLEEEAWHPLDAEPIPDAEAQEAAVRRYVEERGRRLAAPLMAALASRSIAAEQICEEGADPAEVICDVAEEIGADLVMMGATKKIFGDAWRSVSATVIENTRVPVLLIPHVEQDERDAGTPQGPRDG
jgi:nucleotide-binding universal stress UspA family protein